MASLKGLVSQAIGGLFFTQTRLVSIREPAQGLRELTVEGEALRGARCEVGDKAQVLVPGPEVRTYTPYGFDSARGSLRFLVFSHGVSSPGVAWGRSVTVGETVQFLGPQRSLAVPATGPVVLFGDETSLAVSHDVSRRGPARMVLEVTNAEQIRAALPALALEDVTLVERRPSDAHLQDVAVAIEVALAKTPTASLLLTGRAQSIQAVKRTVKAPARTRAYWSVGKKGLD